jgi:hypothetical protein
MSQAPRSSDHDLEPLRAALLTLSNGDEPQRTPDAARTRLDGMQGRAGDCAHRNWADGHWADRHWADRHPADGHWETTEPTSRSSITDGADPIPSATSPYAGNGSAGIPALAEKGR